MIMIIRITTMMARPRPLPVMAGLVPPIHVDPRDKPGQGAFLEWDTPGDDRWR